MEEKFYKFLEWLPTITTQPNWRQKTLLNCFFYFHHTKREIFLNLLIIDMIINFKLLSKLNRTKFLKNTNKNVSKRPNSFFFSEHFLSWTFFRVSKILQQSTLKDMNHLISGPLKKLSIPQLHFILKVSICTDWLTKLLNQVSSHHWLTSIKKNLSRMMQKSSSIFAILIISFHQLLIAELISSSSIQKCYNSTKNATNTTLQNCSEKLVVLLSIDNNQVLKKNLSYLHLLRKSQQKLLLLKSIKLLLHRMALEYNLSSLLIFKSQNPLFMQFMLWLISRISIANQKRKW